MASVIPVRRTVGSAARRAVAPASAPQWLFARLADAVRQLIGRRELCGLPERLLLDIGLSRGDLGRPADIRLAVLQGSDRSGTSLLYVPRP